jgi:hypothetical protein
MVYLEGNHEYWLRKAAEYNPNGKGFWELEVNLPKSIEILPMNKPYRASDHLYVTHGSRVNKYHAYWMVHDWHKSILYGHTHDHQSYTEISPIDETQFVKGQSCGCLCTINPDYLKNKPNRWANGFEYIYVEKETGFFWDQYVAIVNGKFHANGRWYK